MSLLLLFYHFATVFQVFSYTSDRVFNFQGETSIKLVSRERGVEIIGKPDEYVLNLRNFDLEGRLQGMKNANFNDYLMLAQQQVGDWSNEDAENFRRLILSVESKLKAKGIHLNLPDTIEVINSTCQEEGGVIGYTREYSMIMSDQFLYEDVFLHELFHVFSRFNPEIKEELYGILGFIKCNKIDIPVDQFKNIMTNPDATVYDHFLTIIYNDLPLDVLPVMVAKSAYTEGGFFSYMDKRLAVLKTVNGNRVLDIRENKPVLLQYHNVTGIYEQIGRNTDLNFHPEEICAEHFILLVKGKKNLNNQELIEKMYETLKK